jgi:low affinity Fe/Cu permease
MVILRAPSVKLKRGYLAWEWLGLSDCRAPFFKPLGGAETVMTLSDRFSRFAGTVAKAAGAPFAFALAGLSVFVWAVTGPVVHFSETWQLVINTGTTVVTFLMVFLIQNSQNRDSQAVQLKLDEIIFALHNASNDMVDIENLDQRSLDALKARYEQVLHHADKRGREEGHRRSSSAAPDESPKRLL